MKPRILHEDDQILVIDKPAGLVVNRCATLKSPTLQDWLAENYRWPLFDNQSYRHGIVHRLDKETSGILLVAKNEAAFACLQSQFKARKVRKIYSALVHGELLPKKGIIRAPIGRSPFDRKKFGIFLGGRPSETEYQVVKCLRAKDGSRFSLLELKPKTGRTHQIRVHLKYVGHPVVADDAYAGRKTARQDRLWCPRQFLHASRIIFFHPSSAKTVSFESPLPPELKKVLSVLENEKT